MRVVDTSVVVDALVDGFERGDHARRTMSATGPIVVPDIAHIEVASALRRLNVRGTLGDDRLMAAVGQVQDLFTDVRPTGPLLARVMELRHDLTAYDAAYVALAEGLGCPLLTADARLASAPGPRCRVELLAIE